MSVTPPEQDIAEALGAWRRLLGDRPAVSGPIADRELWRVTATDGTRFYAKRLERWRNLPLADEQRVLVHLVAEGIQVPCWQPTDDGALTTGPAGAPLALMPELSDARLTPERTIESEARVGTAVAELHDALDRYPHTVDSYEEDIAGSLTGEMHLPPNVLTRVVPLVGGILDALDALPRQLTHGDLTPENVLRSSDGGVVGFLDLDHLPRAPRLWDAAKYLSHRLRSRWREGSPVDVLGGVRTFVDGYGMTPAERQALPDAILAANVVEASYYREVADGLLPRRMLPDHAAVLEDTVATVRWHLDHRDEVGSAAATDGSAADPIASGVLSSPYRPVERDDEASAPSPR